MFGLSWKEKWTKQWDKAIKEKVDVVSRPTWPFAIWPYSSEYQIINRELEDLNKYQLKAFYGGEWIDCLILEDYCGEVQWRSLGNACNWKLNEIKKIKNELMGKSNPQIVLE